MTTKKNSAAAKKAPEKKTTITKEGPAGPVVNERAKLQGGVASKQAAKKMKKEHKAKIVRDSFTMPQGEYQKIAEIKESCLKAGMHVKKSEVLRAGLKALGKLDAAQLKRALAGLEKIKTGRPKKH